MDVNEFSEFKSDLYFLIHKFLSNGPLKKTLETFIKEVNDSKILPERIDWEGNKHERTVEDMEKQFPFMPSDYLLQLCIRASIPFTNATTLKNSISLLSLKKNCPSRSNTDYNFKQLINYVTRRRMMPIHKPDSARNLVNVIRGQEISGTLSRRWMVSPKLYSLLQLQRRTLGHLSAVYCTLFDGSGRYIVTGADDLLIKIWSSLTGRLIATFRGASSEITDIAINVDNTLLAAGSIDRILRIWDLQTGVPVAVLSGHTGMITSVNFCPSPSWNVHYLITTSTDGSVAFWPYTYDTDDKINFRPKPTTYQEKMRPGQAQMICSSFSPGGTFLATGSADHHVRVYYMKGDEGPHRILEQEAHSDRVDSIQWAHSGLRFLSGSKDGTAIIWTFETQQWKSFYLHMTPKFSSSYTSKKSVEDAKKLKVTMVNWDYSDNWVITAVSDHTLKIWHSSTGQFEKTLSGHTDEIYVLESHPHDKHVILSAGHDGQLFIWDLLKGEIISRFINTIEGQGYGAIFDVKWSPDGTVIAATDSHGHIIIFGFGSGNSAFQKLPKDLFFHTDYRPLVRDINNYVLDEQTQIPPHLMPPPFLVDIDGNPYPPMLQRLVPGREHCKTEQLVPSIVLGNEGTQEVIQVVHEDSTRQEIPLIGPGSSGRRLRDSEGIRQSTGEWQSDPDIKWNKRVLIPPLNAMDIAKFKETIDFMEKLEMTEYQRQMRLRPHMINTTPANEILKLNEKKRRPVLYRTRNTSYRAQLQGVIEPPLSSESSVEESEDTDASGYSDWMADVDVNLESTKRTRRRQVDNDTDSEVDVEVDVEADVEAEEEQVKVKVNEKSNTKEKSKPKLRNYNNIAADIHNTSEWLTEVKPRKAPYFPQMGDELVYFIQGHHLYLDAIRSKKIYEINNKNLPWAKINLRGFEFVKVVGIQYEIKPPRICCLKLAMLDEQARLTGKMFTVKYHDMPDVLDFFVLKQNFEIAMSRNWKEGDKFRCLIDDEWWIGEVVSKSSINEEFHHSPFLCYEIKWDNGEQERMSPWDMEPINENRIPENFGDALPVLEEEIENILYQPIDGDWPNNDRVTITKNILTGLAKIMELAIAEPFLVPVDVNVYPTYASTIEYPIDLSTIKARFENHFYRRIIAGQFDIRHLAINAEKFNERHSVIVKNARILTELCLRIIKQCTTDLDVTTVYHQLIDTYDSTDTEVEVEILPSNSRMLRSLPNRYLRHAGDWKMEAKTLFEAIWDCEDSVPFRTPVNSSKYPDYHQVINSPMDLTTVKEKLHNNKYETPNDFCRDIRLIFRNSRTYNTNKRSRIHVMTVRLSAIFEEHATKIIHNWKVAKRRNYLRNTNYTATTLSASSDSVSSSSSSSSESVNSEIETGAINTHNTTTTTNNNKNNKSTSNSSDSDDNMPLKSLQLLSKPSLGGSSSFTNDNNDSNNVNSKKSLDDSEDSYVPENYNRKRRRRNKKLSSTEDDDDDDEEEEEVEEEDDGVTSDSSDNEPLSLHVKRSRNKLVKRLRLRHNSDLMDEQSEDESNLRNNTSVSSRGRIRKLTPRALALMKK